MYFLTKTIVLFFRLKTSALTIIISLQRSIYVNYDQISTVFYCFNAYSYLF